MSYIAHIDNLGSEQTVEDHLENTANYARRCLESAGLGNAAYLSGCIHDMGKFSDAFQQYIRGISGRRGEVIHTFQCCRLMLEKYHTDANDYKCITSELIAFSASAHHGLFDCYDELNTSGFEHRMTSKNVSYDEAASDFLELCGGDDGLNKLFDAAHSELMPVYNKIINNNLDESLFRLGMLSRLLLSAVIEGDRRDTAEFMEKINYPVYKGYEDKAEFWGTLLKTVENKIENLPNETEVQQIRRKISKQCKEAAAEPCGIYRLNVPTGAGKTLSSLRYALSHASLHKKSRIIFTAPLLSILEQNAEVIRNFIGNDSVILEHHSNVIKAQEDENQLDKYEILAETWNSPIIITTLVQLLNTLFSGKTTAIRRFHSLADSIIVIDEVQTVPTSMLTLFNLAVSFLSQVCGATIVLCSATQPCHEKAAHGITPAPKDIVPYDASLWEALKRTEILRAESLPLEEIPSFALSLLNKHSSLLVVCNKKDEAAEIYEKLCSADTDCFHLSAAMCVAHRRDVLREMKQSLAAGIRKTVCVSTQVIEAGVDISFDAVIRLTAGMDSVIQAAGRCNRNGQSNTPMPVYVLNCTDETLKGLDDIQQAKHATEALLTEFEKAPEKFLNDLSSNESIAFYYSRLYGNMPKGAQDFQSKEHGTLFELLSSNPKYSYENKRYYLTQAFKLAGKLFKVFDDDTETVLVPYCEGAEIIADISELENFHDEGYFIKLQSILEKSKPYGVSAYKYQINKLKEAGALTELCGGRVLALQPDFIGEIHYDENTGLYV